MAFETDHRVIVTLGQAWSSAASRVSCSLFTRDSTVLGNALQARFGASSNNRFSEGFVTTSLIFCVGPHDRFGRAARRTHGRLSTLGDSNLCSMGVVALTFAAGFWCWRGVFPHGTILIVQGSISLMAGHLENLLTEAMIAEMVAAGGLMVLGIGFCLARSRAHPRCQLPARAGCRPLARRAHFAIFIREPPMPRPPQHPRFDDRPTACRTPCTCAGNPHIRTPYLDALCTYSGPRPRAH